jgi:tRNA(fMet)-specific endonuclease VapC
MYLLDTNHCSRLLAGDAQVLGRITPIEPRQLTTCVIVQGELVFMAERSARRTQNLRQVEALCSRLLVYEIDSATADWYGNLKAALLDRFGPKDSTKRRKVTIAAIGVSDNDLWIAAVAKHWNCALVSADADFTRIGEVTDLTVESWVARPA